jgi:hypothetical protein
MIRGDFSNNRVNDIGPPVAASSTLSYAAATSLCALRGASIAAREQIADMNETIEGSGKDRPLRDDIRLQPP